MYDLICLNSKKTYMEHKLLNHILNSLIELIARMVHVVLSFFTFSPHLLKIADILPMVCHFVTRIVPE
ncbi:hypothetical protein Hanom_Chr00s000006g01614351 [Helianthus anomalus]